jgi:hypothetical protein
VLVYVDREHPELPTDPAKELAGGLFRLYRARRSSTQSGRQALHALAHPSRIRAKGAAMEGVVFFFIWILNFGISIWNAYAVGLAWVETKHAGGWPRFMAWMGAIMSASGFTWCYLIALVFIAHHLKWIGDDQLVLALNIGYILLMPGILFSGLMITLDSWARAYRTRSIADMGIAAWNTYAQIHNTYNAINDYDKAIGAVVDSLSKGGSSSSSDKKDGGGVALLVVIGLVIVALLAGVITTAVIINRVAGNNQLAEVPRPEEKK